MTERKQTMLFHTNYKINISEEEWIKQDTVQNDNMITGNKIYWNGTGSFQRAELCSWDWNLPERET